MNNRTHSVFIPFQPFDLELCNHHFPRPTNPIRNQEESKLTELLLQRNKIIVLDPEIANGLENIFIQVIDNYIYR